MSNLGSQEFRTYCAENAPAILREKRKSLGLTQIQAAKCCSVHVNSYARWETGACKVPATAIATLQANAPGFRPPLSAGFEQKTRAPAQHNRLEFKQDKDLVQAVRKVLPPFAPTAGPLVDPLDSVARCVGLIKMIRDALRDGGLS